MAEAVPQTPSFEEINIPMPWGQVSGKWWGARGRQPIIALHGWQDNAGTFDGVAANLPNDISMLALDLPGHGKSSHFPKGQFYYLYWDFAVVLRRIVKYYKWNKIQIIGHSMGGGVGFLYAAAFPDEVEKLIGIDVVSPPVRDAETLANITGPTIDRFLKYETLTEDDMPCYTKNEMLDLVVDAYHGGITRASAEVLMIRGMSQVAPKHKNALKDDGFLFARDIRLKVAGLGLLTLEMILEYASRIKCEYMNIRAKPGQIFDHPDYYSMILDKIEGSACRFERHDVNGTHHLHLNDPETVTPLIVKFIKTNKPGPVVNGSASST